MGRSTGRPFPFATRHDADGKNGPKDIRTQMSSEENLHEEIL